MADIAGTAVGVTSLGIQVCQGLISYLHSFRERTQSITEMLGEVSSLVSIFYLLKDIAPKLNQEQPGNATAIRNCLSESEQKLLELQTFVLSLRGPEHCNTKAEKIRDAARSLLYPFREGKVESLRKTLQALLDRLGLAVNTVALESNLLSHGKLDSIRSSIDRCETDLQNQRRDINDLTTLAQQNSSQFSMLGKDTKIYYDGVVKRLNQSNWTISSLDQRVMAGLEVIRTDARSTASNNIVNFESMTALLEQQGSRIDSMLRQITQSLASSVSNSSHNNVLSGPDSSTPVSVLHQGAFRSDLLIRKKRVTIGGDLADLATCSCAVVRRPCTFSFTLGNLTLQYKQDSYSRHGRGCKYYGIDKKKRRAAQLQFPLTMGLFSSRMTLACIDFVSGNGPLGASVRYTQRVRNCPVAKLIERLDYGEPQNIHAIRPWSMIVRDLRSTERAIRSLYRDGKASPNDLSEYEMSHLEQLLDVITLIWPYILPPCILFHDQVVSEIIKIIRTLKDLTQDNEIMVRMNGMFFAMEFYEFSPVGLQYLTRYLSSSFEVDPSVLRNSHIDEEFSPLMIWAHFPYVIDGKALEMPPLAYAILRRSLTDLENCILRSPAAVREQPFGLTCLELSLSWPEGLERLLKTRAKEFLNKPTYQGSKETPIMVVLKRGKAESSQVLLAADCIIDLNDHEMELSTSECARVVAINLAERRRRLFDLAKQELGVCEDIYGVKTADNEAASLCQKLDNKHVPIPAALRVPTNYASIYHCKSTSLLHFKIFFENGFPDIWSLNRIGLTPVMVHLDDIFFYRRDPSDIPEIQWLILQGLFDQRPVDRLRLGLNTYANGWHYLAGKLGYRLKRLHGISKTRCPYHDIVLAMQTSPSKTTDICICWCSAVGSGCSALKSFWKSWANTERLGGEICSNQVKLWRQRSSLRHILLHTQIWNGQLKGTELISISLDLVRFLTFEALEMTHTCCSWVCARPLEAEGDDTLYPTIMNPDPNLVQEVRSSSSEQENAALLDELMGEFAEKLNKVELDSSSVENFLWGYWRYRISALFATKPNILADMQQQVENLETHVLPESVRYFLGPDFQLLKGDELDIAKDKEIEGEHVVNKGGNTARTKRDGDCAYCKRDREIIMARI